MFLVHNLKCAECLPSQITASGIVGITILTSSRLNPVYSNLPREHLTYKCCSSGSRHYQGQPSKCEARGLVEYLASDGYAVDFLTTDQNFFLLIGRSA